MTGALTIESHERAEQLVIDLLASQVHGKEVQDICVKSLENPMKVLAKILKYSGMEPPEPRLLFQTGIGASNPYNLNIVPCIATSTRVWETSVFCQLL